jgi:hypothetical protein
MAARAPMQVHIPRPEADRPSWVRIGVIAVIGFAVGIAWPRIAGVRLGPSAPKEASVPAESAAPITSSVPIASAAPVASVAPVVSAPPPVAAPPIVTVTRGTLVSCKTDAGESLKGKDCGKLTGFDSIAQARIRKIAASPAAQDNEGKLTVLVTLDFGTNKVVYVDVPKSSTVKNPEAFKSLLTSQFQGVSLGTVDHDQPRVTMSYAATLAPASGSASAPSAQNTGTATPAATPVAADDGAATIVWDVAIVRDAPHTGAVVARLPRGTKVKLGDNTGGWFKIKYGNGFASDGFVYRGAVGK